MAKSARSSNIKKNRTRLKSKVFGPVEDARTKRLSQKLAALASQPKAATSDMEVEKAEGGKHTGTDTQKQALIMAYTDPTTVEQESKETSGHADGALRSSLSIPIPKAMLVHAKPNTQLPLTPPPTPPSCAMQDTFPSPTNHAANSKQAEEMFFFHTLGMASDIRGFDRSGYLVLDFDSTPHPAMDIDGNEATEAKTTSRKQEKKRKEAKSARIEKKRHRKPRNTVAFTKKRQPSRKAKN
ncbi:Gephyrin [Sphaceloma murrayae]|uniref:Gephyrin n=1 Tax=Sphaceloma murrayae TaxID=2082308 RepID=A0A2K1QU96_9PEZI|nr:Gephyrin [Sphaceloma murrayae]